MTGLSDNAIYANWSYAKEGDNISIIEKQYIRDNNWWTAKDTAARYDPYLFSTDDTKFLDGVLTSRKSIGPGGYGRGPEEFIVTLNDGRTLTFQNKEPYEYYFKLVEAPRRGGSAVKRNKRSGRKTIRKSRRNTRRKSRRNKL